MRNPTNNQTDRAKLRRLNYGVTGVDKKSLARNLYVADTGNATLRKIGLATGEVSTPVGRAGQTGVQLGPLPARLNRPVFVAAAPAAGLFIVDGTEGVLLQVR